MGIGGCTSVATTSEPSARLATVQACIVQTRCLSMHLAMLRPCSCFNTAPSVPAAPGHPHAVLMHHNCGTCYHASTMHLWPPLYRYVLDMLTQESTAGMSRLVKRLGLLSYAPAESVGPRPSSRTILPGNPELPHLHRNRDAPPASPPLPPVSWHARASSAHTERTSRISPTTSSPRDHLAQLLSRECQSRGQSNGKPQNRSQGVHALAHACEDSDLIVQVLSAAFADDLRLLPYTAPPSRGPSVSGSV